MGSELRGIFGASEKRPRPFMAATNPMAKSTSHCRLAYKRNYLEICK
jgi:hypothetical protein